jgi:hypothetical protein
MHISNLEFKGKMQMQSKMQKALLLESMVFTSQISFSNLSILGEKLLRHSCPRLRVAGPGEKALSSQFGHLLLRQAIQKLSLLMKLTFLVGVIWIGIRSHTG